MNILELLRADHQKVSDLLSQMEDADFATQRTLFPQLEQEIVAHSKAEERNFYAVLAGDREMVSHAQKEHATVTNLLNAVRGALGRPQYKEYLGKLRDAIEHHVEEEEGDMFSYAQKVLSEEDLDALGNKFSAAKASLASM